MNSIEKLYRIFLENPSICIDSRKIKPGDLFFALQGERFNGNSFAPEAIKMGASLAVVDEPVNNNSDKIIRVEKVLKTLQQLAQRHRDNLKAKIIGITGSNGKTTTKELIYKVLSSTFPSQATEGNLNNHIGVPLTILSLKPATEFAIIEMGANHVGEITRLCHIAKPSYGIITNIGKAHLEGFGDLDGVIRGKSELYDYLRKKNGMVFINADNPLLAGLARGISKYTYGVDDQNNCVIHSLQHDPFIKVQWKQNGKWITIQTKLYGSYNIENIAAAVSIGQYFDVPKREIVRSLSNYFPENNRSQVIRTEKENTLIMDAYNANPSSMNAAIRSFSDLPAKNKFVILGDMLEVGEKSQSEHQAIIDLLIKLNFEHVALTGKVFGSLDIPENYVSLADIDQLKLWLRKIGINNHTVLIKGSRKNELEKIVELL